MGQAMEKILTNLARYKSGANSPFFVDGYGVTRKEAEDYQSQKFALGKQISKKGNVIILTRFDIPKLEVFITDKINIKYGQKELLKL